MRKMWWVALLLAGCTVGGQKPGGAPSGTPAAVTPPAAERRAQGLQFRISEGRPQAGKDKVPLASVKPLAPAELDALLKRLPAIQSKPEDRADFALRDSSLPPPRTAKTVPVSFPPPDAGKAPPAPTPTPGPLQVTHAAPKGPVEMAPHVTVTFNRPMVPLTTVEQVGEKDLPVKLTPQPQGQWRWLGTQTVMFQPKVRMPMATHYKVDVPGVTSFDFTTPTVQVIGQYPTGSGWHLKPLLFLSFNQDVDPKAVLETVKLTTDGSSFPLRMATLTEVTSDQGVTAMADQAGKTRSLVAAATQPLLPGHTYTVQVGPGTPSLEGPLKTDKPQTFSFSTYDPLRVDGFSKQVQPLQEWHVGFNNQLDPSKFDPQMVQVSPALPGLKVQAQPHGIQIRGRSKGRTTYTVRLDPRITDQFGQTLGKSESLTVQVQGAQPYFQPPGQAMVVLDPEGPRQLTCHVVNHKRLKVTAWRMRPEDWQPYIHYQQNFRSNLKDLKTPGELVFDEELSTGAALDELSEVKIDLARCFPGGLGHAMVKIETWPPPKEQWQRQPWLGWVQSTKLGLDAMADDHNLIAWVNDLQTGKPVPGAQVQLLSEPVVASSSDAEGLARLKLANSASLLVARLGADLAILPRDYSYWGGSSSWGPGGRSDQHLWYIADDRKLYRPGEKVSLKGWLRTAVYGPRGDLVATAAKKVTWSLSDSQGNEISKGSTDVGRLGGFHLELSLPKTMNLGMANLQLSSDAAGSGYHNFQVEEFRRPEFEVTVAAEPNCSVIGQNATLTATAAYFSGGPLPNAKVQWNVSTAFTSFSPPGWDGFTFGTWTPWWNYEMPDYHGRGWGRGPRHVQGQSTSQSFENRTGSKGEALVRLDFQSVEPDRPVSVSAHATVQDVNRQTWTAQTSVLVHPCPYYVGLKSSRTFVQKGEPLQLSAIVTDLEGKAVPGKIVQVRAHRLDYSDFQPKEADVDEQQITSASVPVDFKIATGEGGTYQIEAVIVDGNLRNSSQLTMWVAGGKQAPGNSVAQESMTLVPSKKEYEPSDTAEILAQAPFSPAELIVSVRRNGIAEVTRLSAPQGSATVKIPLNEVYVPGVTVQIDAVGQKVRTDPNGEELPGKPVRPAYASGTITLAISQKSRKLDVAVAVEPKSVRPGEKSRVSLRLTDGSGQPVSGGEVALFVVDEAVLALTGYDPADPLATFCTMRGADAYDAHLRQYVLLQKAPELEQQQETKMRTRGEAVPAPSMAAGMDALADAPGAGGRAQKANTFASEAAPAPAAAPARAKNGGHNQPTTPIRVRSDFRALAHFAPTLTTDEKGVATVEVKLPDSLTRYRLVALAAAGAKQFGKGESSLVARQPLMLRPSAPRFLNFGDRFELPVVLQNQSDHELQVQLACRATNARLEQAGYRLSVKPNDRVEVRFPCSADQAGTARFQFAATAGPDADAAEISLPVWTPATTEAFATYGVLDEGAVSQPMEKPKDVYDQFGGLSVTTTSTALSELTDAYLYLENYPFECSEQIASRMLAAAALKDVLEAFKAPGMPTRAQVDAAMERDLERLRGLQNYDGGWDFWIREAPSQPFMSVHVAHTLVRVKQKGFQVDPEMLARALEFCNTIESHIPGDYGPETRRSIRAYAVYVLELEGKPNGAKALELARESAYRHEIIGWLLPTLAKSNPDEAAKMHLWLDNHVTQTAANAQFVTGYSDQSYLVLYSDRRDDGLLLESLIRTKPASPLIPKLVRGLLDHRTAGRWANTQENCWVLLALDRYFETYEKVTPNFVARLWLGDRFAGEQQFRGRDKDEKLLKVGMKDVAGPLVISKEGPGRLYYRLGLQYAPRNLKLPPSDQGFTVRRTYEPVGDNRDVTRDKEGVWHVKAGAEVRVTITMHAPSRRTHVALVDPLPAGFEAVNPALLGTRPQQSDPRRDWWSGWWFRHQNMRDERVEAFTDLLWEGVYTYSYIARATTPGNFVVPPAKAEEMYHPETFGRSATERVVVE